MLLIHQKSLCNIKIREKIQAEPASFLYEEVHSAMRLNAIKYIIVRCTG